MSCNICRPIRYRELMSPPIRSMTGFARVQKSTPHGDIVVSLKSVNHRGLDLHFHLGSELDALENSMRAADQALRSARPH